MSGKFLNKLVIFPLLASCAPPIVADPAPLPPHELTTPQQWAAGCKDWDDWDKPARPYRIYGSTFYVGTCGISAILIADPAGHVLIDSGTEAGAMVVMDNIRKLGFRLNEVALILHSHEHFDHVGGNAQLRQASGAHVVASPEAAEVLRTGKSDPTDPQHGLHKPMTPVTVDRIVRGGETVRTENRELTAIATPGHTSGALSWSWTECGDNDGCKQIVYADSLSPVAGDSYHFADHPAYLAAYRASLARLAALQCDILLTPHPSASDMVTRAASGSLVGGMNCAEYAAAMNTRLDERIAKEGAGD